MIMIPDAAPIPNQGAAGPVPSPSEFEADIAGQPAALRALARSGALKALPPIDLGGFDRVILTGMGASYYSMLPAWRRLVAAGHAAWWQPTGELVDSPGLLTSETLLWITSQSGQTGEVVALLDRLGTDTPRPSLILGVTNDEGSPLASGCDLLFSLCAGAESTVSTKSYMNSVAAQHLLLTRLTGGPGDAAAAAVAAAADELEALPVPRDAIRVIAAQVLTAAPPRIALIGAADQAASALTGALVIKEAAKLAAEAFTGGEFRHGPVELAGPGLTALVFTGLGRSRLSRLASEIRETGSLAVEIGRNPGRGGQRIVTQASSELSQIMADARLAQQLSVELARSRSLTPGEFRYGRKVTSCA
jgi:glutamine---fructose-6-phosphate transaminase (isomerizing)